MSSKYMMLVAALAPAVLAQGITLDNTNDNANNVNVDITVGGAPQRPSSPSAPNMKVTTTVVTAYSTYCPEPTVLWFEKQRYVVTRPTMVTLDCPCTITTSVPMATLIAGQPAVVPPYRVLPAPVQPVNPVVPMPVAPAGGAAAAAAAAPGSAAAAAAAGSGAPPAPGSAAAAAAAPGSAAAAAAPGGVAAAAAAPAQPPPAPQRVGTITQAPVAAATAHPTQPIFTAGAGRADDARSLFGLVMAIGAAAISGLAL